MSKPSRGGFAERFGARSELPASPPPTETAKVTGEKLHSIHVRLDEARYQELKVYAARNSKTVQTILSEYIDTLTRQK
jgi:hypothetical protein